MIDKPYPVSRLVADEVTEAVWVILNFSHLLAISRNRQDETFEYSPKYMRNRLPGHGADINVHGISPARDATELYHARYIAVLAVFNAGLL